MAQIHLDRDERPIGYRFHYGKPVWFLNAWTTVEEARRARDHEIAMGRSATIVEKYIYPTGQHHPSTRYYAVYSEN